MSPRHRRGDETRERLLTAALDLYARHGAEGFTMTAVTGTSGVSVGSLYHHFGSFDALAAALYARCLSDLLDAVLAALDTARDDQAARNDQVARITGEHGGGTVRTGEERGGEERGGEERGGEEHAGQGRAEEAPAALIRALVTGYLGFTREHRAAAHFVHASAYAGFLTAHPGPVAAEKAPRVAEILGRLRPYTEAGLVVELPDGLTETLVVGPVAETARRWLAGAPGVDLDEACRLLPERIWHSLRA